MVALVACALAATLGRTGWLRTLENLYADSWTVLAGERYTPRHTALVVIDDDTLAALKDDPIAFWAPHFARVLDVLEAAGAKVVGFDYLILVSAEGWLKKLDLPDSMASRAYDAPLRAALARGRTVFFPTSYFFPGCLLGINSRSYPDHAATYHRRKFVAAACNRATDNAIPNY